GIAHVKDTFKIPRDRHEEVTVAAITTPVEFVPESMRLASLLLALQRSRRSIAGVVDEYGGAAGTATAEDIVEAILGEIEDEHDFAGTSRGGPGIVAGSLHRHEVEELTGCQGPEGAYETLSGYVTARLDRFPRVGDVLEEGRYRIEVLGVRGRVAARLRIVQMEEAEDSPGARPSPACACWRRTDSSWPRGSRAPPPAARGWRRAPPARPGRRGRRSTSCRSRSPARSWASPWRPWCW